MLSAGLRVGGGSTLIHLSEWVQRSAHQQPPQVALRALVILFLTSWVVGVRISNCFITTLLANATLWVLSCHRSMASIFYAVTLHFEVTYFQQVDLQSLSAKSKMVLCCKWGSRSVKDVCQLFSRTQDLTQECKKTMLYHNSRVLTHASICHFKFKATWGTLASCNESQQGDAIDTEGTHGRCCREQLPYNACSYLTSSFIRQNREQRAH